MLILGLDTATLSCSVALLQEDTILAELTLNIKKTHSERLMPLIDTMLKEAAVPVKSIQAVAVAAGPGSFTGLRIGVSTARALAQGLNIPAVGVSTLEALAGSVPAPAALICPLLDARRNQVYAALYRRLPQAPNRLQTLIKPAALALTELSAALKQFSEPVTFIGEGLHTYAQALVDNLPAGQAIIAPAAHRYCRAALVAARAAELLQMSTHHPYENLAPLYLRKPEAERLADPSLKQNPGLPPNSHQKPHPQGGPPE